MGSIRILIVEDEFMIAMSLESELTEAGYDIIKIVNSGEKAVEISRIESPDVILMDIGLADKMDGIEAARQIRSFSQIPIIFMTGYSDLKITDQFSEFTSIEYMIKPVFIHNLKPIIEAIFTAKKRT